MTIKATLDTLPGSISLWYLYTHYPLQVAAALHHLISFSRPFSNVDDRDVEVSICRTSKTAQLEHKLGGTYGCIYRGSESPSIR
jgi:hypothetical protein